MLGAWASVVIFLAALLIVGLHIYDRRSQDQDKNNLEVDQWGNTSEFWALLFALVTVVVPLISNSTSSTATESVCAPHYPTTVWYLAASVFFFQLVSFGIKRYENNSALTALLIILPRTHPHPPASFQRLVNDFTIV